MHASRSTFVLALVLVTTASLLSPPECARACDPYRKPSLFQERFSATWGSVSWETARGSCPEPPCTPITDCETFEENTVFVRPAAYSSMPIFDPQVPGSYCFSIAKFTDTLYYHLHAAPANQQTGEPAGFRNAISQNGIDWTPGNLAFPSSGTWYPSIICPDVHRDADTGETYLFFQGAGNGIGYATSPDNGRTFVDSGAPVLTSETPGYNVRTPSVAKVGSRYYMVYNLTCVGAGAPFQLATLNLATSADRIHWRKSVNNPIVVPGPCGSFDVGTTALGQLVADPDGVTLHLFYTGTGWFETPSGGGTTRGCAKVAHAVSTDGGKTWCKTGSPVLDHPPAGSGAWDDKNYYVTSYTWEESAEGEDVLRMYYWGEGETYDKGLGVAEALATDLPACPDGGGLGSRERTVVGPVHLGVQPNPTHGRLSISVPSDVDLQGAVTLRVYDLSGRRVRDLWSGRIESLPVELDWDGRAESGQVVGAGRYLVRLEREDGQAAAAAWMTYLR